MTTAALRTAPLPHPGRGYLSLVPTWSSVLGQPNGAVRMLRSVRAKRCRYQVGSALGLAVMTALASSQGADQLGDLGALTDGYPAAFLGAAGIAVAGAALAAVLLRTPKADVTGIEQSPETSEPIAA